MWRIPTSKTEASTWQRTFKSALLAEDEQIPHWCEALALNLPDYAYLVVPKAAQFGIHTSENATNISTNAVLTRLHKNKPVAYLKFSIEHNKKAKDLTIKLHDVYIVPEHRGTGLTLEVIDLIRDQIQTSVHNYNVTTPVIVESLIASTSGLMFYNKLKTALEKTNLKLDFNTVADPSYTL